MRSHCAQMFLHDAVMKSDVEWEVDWPAGKCHEHGRLPNYLPHCCHYQRKDANASTFLGHALLFACGCLQDYLGLLRNNLRSNVHHSILSVYLLESGNVAAFRQKIGRLMDHE